MNNVQRSITICLTPDEDPARQIKRHADHLDAGYVVRVETNGIAPYQRHLDWFRADLKWDFIKSASDNGANDIWWSILAEAWQRDQTLGRGDSKWRSTK